MLNRLYIYGGCGIEEGTIATLWCLDTTKVLELDSLSPEEEVRRGATVEWKKVDTLGAPLKPGPLAHHTSVVYGEKMYLFGGSGPRVAGQTLPDGTVPSTWALDLRTMRWEAIIPRGNSSPEDQPQTRDDHIAVNYNDEAMIVFGGFVDGGERANDMWSYSFAENRWI